MAPKEIDFAEIAYQRAKEKKTHVSFPQLKYPSLRDGGLRDPVQWLTGKAMDDGAEGLWRVHDGIYDLNDFVKNHPGGSEWLELSKGTDITESFESHHLNISTEKLLAKFYVREAKTPRNSPFTFKDDGFYRSLKRAVAEELKKVPDHIPKNADRITDGLFTSLLINSTLCCWFDNYWLIMVTYLLASLSLSWLVVAAHNYIHRKTNWRMYLFNFSLWSYRDFRVSHALSHHPYPNTLMDLEVSAFEPIIYWNPRKDIPFYAKFGFLSQILMFPFSFLLNFFKRFISNFIRKGFFKQHYRWHDGLGLLLPVWMCLTSGCSPTEAFVNWLWIICTSSCIFYHIGTNAAHHHPDIFKDGDEASDVTLDWGMHEVEAVSERKDINGNLFKVMTFFGDHTLHHLFPTLDHAVLPYLYPVFLEHVQKYRAKFRMMSSLDLFIGQVKLTMKTEPTLLKDRK